MYLVPAILLAAILALLLPAVQRVLQNGLRQRPALLFVIPALLSAVFLAAAAALGAFSLPLASLILAYTFLPATCAYLVRHAAPPTSVDFVIIALLWFPLEFSLGHQFIPKQAQSALHLAAYGISILLGLAIFLLFSRLMGMKYNLPRSGRDFVNLLLGFAACAPILIPLGRAIGFLQQDPDGAVDRCVRQRDPTDRQRRKEPGDDARRHQHHGEAHAFDLRGPRAGGRRRITIDGAGRPRRPVKRGWLWWHRRRRVRGGRAGRRRRAHPLIVNARSLGA